MTVRIVILPLVYLAAFAQQPSPRALIGAIEKIFGSEIHVRSGQKSITLCADDRTTVSKDAVYHDLSPLKSGDEISVRYAGDGSAKLIALSIWAKLTSFRGIVKQVTPGRLLVGARVVRTYPETIFGAGSRGAATGQELQVTGLDLGNGEVDAVRIAIFNTDLPLNYMRRPTK
jgi:hypothetical protein